MSDEEGNRLGRYLRARRDLVVPEQAGIPAGDGRRVPGLRREEVAMLAGVSADYYLRLEQGRDVHPSAQVIDALARVLHLDDVERAYLHRLSAPTKHRPLRRHTERIPPRLLQLISSMHLPAFIEGRTFDVLAANPHATALSPRLQPGQNRLRSLLLDEGEQALHQDWSASAAGFIAAFRKQVEDDVTDARVVELVGELSLASGRFRELWARHDVRALSGNTSVMQHPVLGELRLHRDKLPVEDVLLVIYYADVGSASADKLDLLGTLISDRQPH